MAQGQCCAVLDGTKSISATYFIYSGVEVFQLEQGGIEYIELPLAVDKVRYADADEPDECFARFKCFFKQRHACIKYGLVCIHRLFGGEAAVDGLKIRIAQF